jgi:hypothetical protein
MAIRNTKGTGESESGIADLIAALSPEAANAEDTPKDKHNAGQKLTKAAGFEQRIPDLHFCGPR